jgi:hypothetical protein
MTHGKYIVVFGLHNHVVMCMTINGMNGYNYNHLCIHKYQGLTLWKIPN